MLWFILTEKCHISCPICQKYGAAVLWNAFPVDKLKLFCYTFVTIVTILLPAAFSAAAPERKFDRYEKTSFQRSVRCFAGSVAERNGPGLHLFRHADGRGGRRGNPCTAHHPRHYAGCPGAGGRPHRAQRPHRTAGKPAADGGVSFADVPGGKYYSAAVSWAAGEGIVTGSGSGNFNPTGKLTREQLAVVLYRYAQYEGRDVSRRADLGAYKDGAKVSSWAKDAMSWAVAEGLITGSNQKNLTPGGSTNRAQLAAILMRYCA